MKWSLLYSFQIVSLLSSAAADPALFSSDTPLDGTIFPVFLNSVLTFNVNAAHTTATDVKIVFRENPDMLGLDPVCSGLTISDRIWCPPKTNQINCSCQLVDMYDSNNVLMRKNLVPTLGKVAAGTYGIVIRRFASMDTLRICFQALWDCDPITDSAGSNSSNSKCHFSSFGILDTEFYPSRCVHIHVKQNPEVFSVIPAENSQMIGSVPLTEGDPMPPWRRAITSSKVMLNVGELLRLNVDAYDPNENDDVDIFLTDDSVIPTTAALGPRLCCADDFSDCQERPFGFSSKIDVKSTSCVQDMNAKPPGSSVTSSCTTTCSQQAQPLACRSVRRVFTLVATDDMVGRVFNSINFYTRDNSGILDNRTQSALPSCCNSYNLLSLINVSAQLQVQRNIPTFLDPTPSSGTILTAYANCPIQAMGLYYYFSGAIGSSFDIVPDGCVLGSVMQGEQKPCTTASPTDCTCLPQWPTGLYLSQPTPFAWTSFSFSKRGDGTIFTWIAKNVQVRFASGNSTITVTLQANKPVPIGSIITIGNISGFTSLQSLIPLYFWNCGGFTNASASGNWNSAMRMLQVPVASSTDLFYFRFAMQGNGPVSGWSITVDPPAQYSPFFWLNATYSATYDSIHAATTIHICLRANVLLPAQTTIILRNLLGLSQANGPEVNLAVSGSQWTGMLNSSMGTMAVSLAQSTHGLSIDFTLLGSVSLDFISAETDASNVDQTVFTNVTIPAMRLQNFGRSCSFNLGTDSLSGISRVGVQRVLRWTPAPSQMGKTYSICFRVMSTTGQTTSRRCIGIKVEKCKRCVVDGDSMVSLADEYSTNWLQLWAANSQFGYYANHDDAMPDKLVPGTMIQLGPLYTSLQTIGYPDLATEFGISQDSLLEANPDFDPAGGMVMTGQDVCMLPAICDSEVAADGSSTS